MVKREGHLFLAFLVGIVLVIPGVIAEETVINVKTLPEHKASIFILKPGQNFPTLESFHVTPDGNGYLSIVFSGNTNLVDIRVKISKVNSTGSGEQIMLEKFESIHTGAPVHLQVIPGNVSENYLELSNEDEPEVIEEEPVEEVVDTAEGSAEGEEIAVEEVVEESEEVDDESAITGSVISDSEGGLSKTFYFVIGAVVLAAVVLLFILKLAIPGLKKDPAFSYKSIQPRDNRSFGERRLQRKLESARAEVRRLKNRDKIGAVREKIEKEKAELRKLERGE